MVKLTIDGQPVTVPAGTSILEAAKSIGIDIPNFCYDKDLTVAGACRMCVVEVAGYRNLAAACATAVAEGMVVQTESERVVEARRVLLELLLANHPRDCMVCEKTGDCRLQDYCYRYGVKESPFQGERKQYAIDSENHLIERDQNKCILCGKCVRVCHEVQVTAAVDFVGRGFNTRVTTPFDLPLSLDICRFCGQCISVCPTGALVNKQMKGVRPWEVKKVRTTCPFCGTGCNFDLNVKDNKIIGVTPNPEAPVNGRSLCVKGRFHSDLVHSPDRITKPLIKKNGEFVEASWDEALNLVAAKFKEIKERDGGDAIAALSSARCTNEDNWVMQKFMRAVIGTNNVDHCART
ncbi:NADH:ubiquinone oxidoreductase, subunit G, iron-sulfur binding protein [Thermincola potens JR]|uniref:NADH:ubiquinone oxidoreductase, subunit G, iron-sulfur binding protein n=3 Tax=Thermincola TaxID=278993 RepID=D5X9H5_THEPJ|nr:NADH:ubiquinone oxidoreductase, subunit G, iron-sulfur binding protein [Thermincola potens JR]